MVVWLARPMRCRCRSGSKPGLAASENRAVSSAAGTLPRMNSQTSVGFVEIAHAQVLAAGVGHRLRRGGARFLVVVLAVDDHGVAVAGVVMDLLPDVEDAAAGGVDQHALLRLEVLELGHADAEGRHDHDIAGGDVAKARHRVARVVENFDAHVAQALVDVGVVDDFAGQEHAAVGKLPAGLVGVVHRAVDAVAKPEFPGELEVQFAGAGLVAEGLEPFDDGALVGTRQNRSDLGFQAETLLKIRLTQRATIISLYGAKWMGGVFLIGD